MIEVMFQVRKDGFKDNPAAPEELDVVEEDDQFTHMIGLDDATNGEEVSSTIGTIRLWAEYSTNTSIASFSKHAKFAKMKTTNILLFRYCLTGAERVQARP